MAFATAGIFAARFYGLGFSLFVFLLLFFFKTMNLGNESILGGIP